MKQQKLTICVFAQILIALLGIVYSNLASAQQILGLVNVDGNLLPGASVRLMNQNLSTFTDLTGSFRLQNRQLGKQRIVISYVGFNDKVMDLDIQSGDNNLGVIALIPKGNELNNVIVKGTLALSQIKAYSIKKNSLAIIEVISADAIGKLPDRNAAEAVQRVQGIAVARYHGEADQATVRGTPFSWTSTLFNGSRLPSAGAYGTRASVLDVVPSELIQFVQVAKAITPDMEGDAIGGSINFITRTSPIKRQLNVSLAGGYNNFSKDGTYNASLVYGDRFFNNKFGVIVAAAIWQRQWGTDSYDVVYNTGLATDVQRKSITSVQFKRYMGKRETIGTNVGLDYKFNNGNKIYFRGMLNKFNDVRPVYESIVDFANSRYQYNYRFSEYQTTLNGLEIGGEHQLNNQWKLNWAASNYESRFFIETPNTTPGNQRGLPISTFRQRITGGFNGLSSDGRKYWNFDSPDGVGDDPMNIKVNLKNPAETMDPTKLTLQQLVIAQLDNKEKDRVANLDLKYSVNLKLNLKFGVKYRNKDKEGINFASLVWVPNAALGVPNAPALVPLSQLNRTSFPVRGGFFKELGGNQDMFMIDPITKEQLFQLYDTGFQRINGLRNVSPAGNATTMYDGKEEVLSGYAMGEYDLSDKLKLVGGFRLENTTMVLNSMELLTSLVNGVAATTKKPVTARNQYNTFLPMLHLKYKITEKMNLRAAYTKTFVRPDFTALIPSSTTNLTTTPNSITKGNPNLKPTYSQNFDLMGEYYFQNIGLISGGLFYKKLKDVIFTDRYFANINGTNTLISEPRNIDNAFLYGFEAGINKRLDFLKGFWSGFGVEFNYTYIKSEANVPRLVGTATVYDKVSLPNQSKSLYNAILFYEKSGLMVRLAGNYRGASVETINTLLGPDYYVWTGNNFTLDASATVTLNKKLRFFVELNNLTNEPLRTYMGDVHRPVMTEWYSQRGQAGIRWDIIK
ncbi:MAG: TonB-dependent receptor [Sediminibacterium sp.]